MQPPLHLTDKGNGLQASAETDDGPITGWMQTGAFDSAKECEDARFAASQHAMKRMPKAGKPSPMGPGELAAFASIEGARCVPSEAVYPPKH